MAAHDGKHVSVLFMFGEEKIQTCVDFGSNINDLLEAFGKVFEVSTSDLTLQSYDNEWEEWVNLPQSFTASTRIKIKVVSKVPAKPSINSNSKNCGFKQVTLKASANTGILELNKEKIVNESKPYEIYLYPNPHTTRLQFYNDVTPILYDESFKDFSSTERFQNYLITERRWRFDIESKTNSLTAKVTDITTNSTNQSNGTAYNIQRLQKVPLDVSSEDVSRGERALSALEAMKNTCEDLSNSLLQKKKTCYQLPNMDLMPGGKSTLQYIQVKLDTLEQLKGTLFRMLDNVNSVLLDLHRRYSRRTSAKAEELRKKRRKKEQNKKNKNKKLKVRTRQTREVCELLTGNQSDIEITKKASSPIINAKNINREALHTKLRKRFHLEPLKDLIQQGYISDCVLSEVKEAIEKLEAPPMTAMSNEGAKDKQVTLTTFLAKCKKNAKPAETTISESSDSEAVMPDSESDSESLSDQEH